MSGRFSAKYFEADVVGVTSGMLTVTGIHGRQKGELFVSVKCDCGTIKTVRFHMVRDRRLKSCGCLNNRYQSFAKENDAVGLYWTWVGMRQRCGNPRSTSYRHYGARGIGICERWNDFRLFFEDVGNKPSPHHSLDRIDNNGGYEPSNVRWATQKEQLSNRRGNRLITVDGITKTVTQWGEANGIHKNSILGRIKRGVPPSIAVTAPPMRTGRGAARGVK